MEELSTDVLIIGSGLAGIISALEAERAGVRVLLISKFAIGMGTNTSLSNGAFTAPTSNFSKEEHFDETIKSGKGLSNTKLVRILVDKGFDAIANLRHYGVSLVEGRMGYFIERPKESSQLPGILLVEVLRDRLKRGSTILIPGLTVFDLIVEGGEIQGAFGFFKDGRPFIIKSKAIVLATGGAGAIYGRNDNQRTILGDGYALALKAGLPLFDLEFVQFYPFVLGEPRLSSFILLPPYPKEARLLNERGEEILESLGIKYDLNQAVIDKRDLLSIRLYEASMKGDVYFDLTHVPEERWNRYPLSFLKKSKFPFRERQFIISPAVHFFMGGVEIDENGRTALPGLFAAGEVVWGIHGANRLGGNALTECSVFGMIAGQSAARYALESMGREKSSDISEPLKRKWERRAKEYMKKKKVAFDHPREIQRELKNLAWKYCGPIREEGLLEEGLHHLSSLEKRVGNIYPERLRELFEKRYLENATLILKAILKGSLLRKESRGSFFRNDFPQQDDSNWLKNTCYSLKNGELKISHRSVC